MVNKEVINNDNQKKGSVMAYSLDKLQGVKGIDYDKYDGVESVIETVEIVNYGVTDFSDGEESIRLVVSTKNVSKDEENEVRGREFISLFYKDKVLCYSESPKSKAQKMLTYFKVANFDALVGKKARILKKISETGKERLGIAYG